MTKKLRNIQKKKMVKNNKTFYGLKLGNTELGIKTDMIKNSCKNLKKMSYKTKKPVKGGYKK